MAAAAAAQGGDYMGRFVAETGWYNDVVLSAVAPGDWWRGLPHPVQSWMRNCVGGYLLYFISGFLWCFVIYYWKRHAYIPKAYCYKLLTEIRASGWLRLATGRQSR